MFEVNFTNRFGGLITAQNNNGLHIKIIGCDMNLSMRQFVTNMVRSFGLLVGQSEGVAKAVVFNISGLLCRGSVEVLNLLHSAMLFGYTTSTQFSGLIDNLSVLGVTFGTNKDIGWVLVKNNNIASLVNQGNSYC